MSIAFSISSSFLGLSLLARSVPMDSVLKSSILIVQKLALYQNGVEFRQQCNGAIRTSLTAPHDDRRRRAILKTLISFFFNPFPSSCRSCQGGSLGFSWMYTCTVYILTDCTVVAWPAEPQCPQSVQSSPRTLTTVHYLYSIDVTNQRPRNLLHRHTHTQAGRDRQTPVTDKTDYIAR